MMEEINNDEEMRKMPLAVRALRRSGIRKRIAEYLFSIRPNYSYASEIARHTNATPTNAIGALRGMDERYKEDQSLIALDIVEIKIVKDVKIYRITSFGIKIVESLL